MSNKRPASAMTDYTMDEAPDVKRYKQDNVQILANNDEMGERINRLIDSKKSHLATRQVPDYLQIDTAAITAKPAGAYKARQAAQEASGELENDAAHSSAPPGPLPVYPVSELPSGLPDAVEDRLRNLERVIYSNLSVRAVPKDVLGRIKALEDRVVALERKGMLPQRQNEAAQATGGRQESVASSSLSSLPPASVDERIRELQHQLLTQAQPH